jgi:ectoine hydroxylase-related dioxygenase (phytanoyl-CoA dioxygenase family)
MPMKAGDVLFFNGQVIHGSFPNVSENRFRRALIAHYIVGDAEQVDKFYHPVLTFDGEEVTLQDSERGGPCGIWVDQSGEAIVELVDNTKR